MSETKFEPVTEAELAQLRELHEAALTTRGWSAGVVAFEKYRAHAVDLAPRMAAHLAEFTVAGQSVCENFRGGTFVDGGECVGWLAVLCGCERICYDCDEPAVDDQACAQHGGEVQP